MSDEKPSLMDLVKQEQQRRQKSKTIEESTFKVDSQAIVEEDDGLISELISQITDEYPVHKKIVDLAEMMGMELNQITEEGDEVYKYKNYIMFINPNKKTMKVDEVYDTGTVFSLHVHTIAGSNLQQIRKDLEFALFLKGDDELKKMIKRDIEAMDRMEKDM
jgi:hypothetical protein